MKPVLELQNVTKAFASEGGAVEVLRGVDLRVALGEFLMVSGPSGAGKTTLLNVAALLERPTAGRVVFDGDDVSDATEGELAAIRSAAVGVVFQKFALLPHRTALDNVRFRFRYTGTDRGEAARLSRDALAEVGLSGIAGRWARLLSAGEMQRVAIARAVALRPKLLVADEPTGNLDSACGHAVMDCFSRLNRAGMTILMVTHNASLLQRATRHVFCRDGRLQDGSGIA
jgi:putative ABC transport system ATP-binding protein